MFYNGIWERIKLKSLLNIPFQCSFLKTWQKNLKVLQRIRRFLCQRFLMQKESTLKWLLLLFKYRSWMWASISNKQMKVSLLYNFQNLLFTHNFNKTYSTGIFISIFQKSRPWNCIKHSGFASWLICFIKKLFSLSCCKWKDKNHFIYFLSMNNSSFFFSSKSFFLGIRWTDTSL